MSSNSLALANPQVIKTIEVAGTSIEIGILPDGTPFLSGRALARACGISNSTLVGWGEWVPKLGDRQRAGKMADLLTTYGYQGESFFVRVPDRSKPGGKAIVAAYPYQVCLAFLDYYAFEVNKEEARNSLRILSEKQLPRFIYEAAYHPTQKSTHGIQAPLQNQPRTTIDPDDYFSILQIISRQKLQAIHHSLALHTYTIRSIDIAKAWSQYWYIQKLWQQHGMRIIDPPKKSNYFLQLAGTSTTESYLYPISALDEFKQWLNLQYIPERFPSYLQRRIRGHKSKRLG